MASNWNVGVVMPAVEMAATIVKLQSLRSAVRRNVLMTVGRKSAAILLPAVKAQPWTKVTGAHAASFKKKPKVYAGKTRGGPVVFVIVGAKNKKQEATKYKDYRTGRIRKWKAGQPAKGPKMVNPAKYTHLAGPGRKNVLLPAVNRRMKGQIEAMIAQTLVAEVRKK